MDKVCSKCSILKDINEFNKDKQKKDGYYSSCRDCARRHFSLVSKTTSYKDRLKKYHSTIGYKGKAKNYYYNREYGIKLEGKKELIKKQNNQCLSCGIDLRLISTKDVCVDFDRNKKKIRGVICRTCKTVLCQLHEDLERVFKLATYAIKCKGTV